MGERFINAFVIGLDIIKVVKDLANAGSFQINTHQCRRLVAYYSRVGEFFEHAMDVRQNYPLNLLPLSLDATISVLQKGQVLLTKYTEEDWYISMTTAGVNQGSFEAILLELEACIQTIVEFLRENVPGIMQFPFMKMAYLATLMPLSALEPWDRAFILGDDAKKDQMDMLDKIESRKLETENTPHFTPQQRSTMIHLLDLASETVQDPTATPAGLPSALQIKPSEITLQSLIAETDSAKVYRCRWLERDCAVKILQTGAVDGLRAEVGNFMKLRHPNIVSLYGFSMGQEPEYKPMIVMELLDGDLRLLLRRHPLPLSRAVDVMHKIASGMVYLHRQRIFHGDLKSMNVLIKDIDGRFELKIADFGVSQQIRIPQRDDSDEDDPINSRSIFGKVGTAMWMAPEVNTSSGAADECYSAKADVYSFSMVCVEILTGKYPYENGMTLKDLKRHVVDEGKRPILPVALPNDLRELIVQCWDVDPQKRPDFRQICERLQKLKVHDDPLVQTKRGAWYDVLRSYLRAAMAFGQPWLWCKDKVRAPEMLK